MRFNKLDDWLSWQETCHPKLIDLGLDRIREVAGRLELLQTPATVITVAGTNGKGSCVRTLEQVLVAQSCRVGAYTSPHLLAYNERIRLDGEPASDLEIIRAFAAIDQARGDISLSYFEFGTLAALWLFREAQLDYWVLEVGLGGRLDATNIIDADIAVITSIALDHQQFLGNDRESIGREKAGILRQGRPLVCSDHDVPASVMARARELDSPVCLAGRDFDWQVLTSSSDATGWQVNLSQAQVLQLPVPQLPQPSVAAALQVLSLLNRLPAQDELARLLAQLRLEGRFQKIPVAGQMVYLDVAHNPAAAHYLAERLRQERLADLGVVLAMMADKDISGCLEPLLPFIHHWWLPVLDMPRAATPAQMSAALVELGVSRERITMGGSVSGSIEIVLNHGQLTQLDCRALLITGSFFTVAAGLASCMSLPTSD